MIFVSSRFRCPENKCEEFVPFDIMQEVLSAEDFDRWERLLFQRTLDSMEDIMYCPKCSNPITIEKSNTHAYCMYCRMDYCKECKEGWHPVSKILPFVTRFFSPLTCHRYYCKGRMRDRGTKDERKAQNAQSRRENPSGNDRRRYQEVFQERRRHPQPKRKGEGDD